MLEHISFPNLQNKRPLYLNTQRVMGCVKQPGSRLIGLRLMRLWRKGKDLGKWQHELLQYILSCRLNAIDNIIFPAGPSTSSLCSCSQCSRYSPLCSIFNKNINRYEFGYFTLKRIKSTFWFFEKKNLNRNKLHEKYASKRHSNKT